MTAFVFARYYIGLGWGHSSYLDRHTTWSTIWPGEILIIDDKADDLHWSDSRHPQEHFSPSTCLIIVWAVLRLAHSQPRVKHERRWPPRSRGRWSWWTVSRTSRIFSLIRPWTACSCPLPSSWLASKSRCCLIWLARVLTRTSHLTHHTILHCLSSYASSSHSALAGSLLVRTANFDIITRLDMHTRSSILRAPSSNRLGRLTQQHSCLAVVCRGATRRTD